MTYLAMAIIAVGCLVIGAALSARALAHEHDSLDRKRVLLDLERKEAARARDEYRRVAAELRASLHLEAPLSSSPGLVLDLGAHRRKIGLPQ